MPLSGLDSLLQESYSKLLDISDSIQRNQDNLVQQMSCITSISKLLVLMMCMKYRYSNQEKVVLNSYFLTDFKEGLETGYEETMDASMTYLLKTCLAKTKKNSVVLNMSTLEIPSSVDGLKKHVAMVVDRLEKGGRVLDVQSDHNERK